jgi:formamidopyrimidine-DNA glycosylase
MVLKTRPHTNPAHGLLERRSFVPELPDVETFKRYVDSTSLHHRIKKVEVDAPRMLKGISARALRTALEGNEFSETVRHGKYLLVHLKGGPWLVLHFGMTGMLAYAREPAAIPKHTRLVIHFANGYRLAGIWQRRLGRIDLADDPASFREAQRLGPDVLGPAIDLKTFKRVLHGHRGTIKAALMDQSLLAGIGNIYSDEILFQSGVRPDIKVSELSDARMSLLNRALRHVLRTAITRQADADRLPKTWLLPRRYKGAKCPRCGRSLEHMCSSGRTAYFCPQCQR